ncbi:MAG: ribosome silencing factor [Robiginitomaculum sp.]|nr:ribosome silencing factor [Robiginitomaculum sp.]
MGTKLQKFPRNIVLQNEIKKSAESTQLTAKQLLELLQEVLDDNKAEDVVSIDLEGKSSVADYLLIATGRSARHVSAIADYILRAAKAAGLGQLETEGMSSNDWILIDAGDVIVHVFRDEVRGYYNLEKIWSVSLSREMDKE